MSITIKQIYSFTLSASLVFGAFMFMTDAIPDVHAQTCSDGDTLGNLRGHAQTDNFGKIYMSTESWNDDAAAMGHSTTTFEFSVSYNRTLNTWDGFGWSPYAGTVDFGEINSDNITARTAEFTDVMGDTAWGNLNPVIDLSEVSYESDPGGFEGRGSHQGYTMINDLEIDQPVGANTVDFSSVRLIKPPCNEAVDLFLSGTSGQRSSYIYQDTCPILKPNITWNTRDIESGSCVTGVGLWSGGSGVKKNDVDSQGELASDKITNENSPVTFKLICTGAGSDSRVTGTAIAQCGTTEGPINPTPNGLLIPVFTEV
jgi:hypothetical protein